MKHPTRSSRNGLRATLVLGLMACAAAPQDGAHDDHEPPHARRAPDDLSGQELVEVQLVQRVLPTVVTIRATASSWEGGTRSLQPRLGTGVLISPECHVLTAAHVVAAAEAITVRTQDGLDRAAELLFSEPGADIALLQLVQPDGDLPHAELGDSDRLAVGQWAYVLGNPHGLENTFTAGRISAFREFSRLYDGTILVEFLQTDAAINSGNSGGPVFDSKGRVIGIASRIVTRSGGSEGLGFAVTINAAKKLLALEGRGWTGFEGVFLDRALLTSLFHVDREGGLLLQTVARHSPAERAGLQGGSIPAVIGGRSMLLGGDLLLKVGDQDACHGACLAATHDRLSEQTRVPVTYLRAGRVEHTVLETASLHRSFLEPEAQ